MNRFFLEPYLITDERVNFPEAVEHQIISVLRLRSGDVVEVLDNQGCLYRVSLEVDLEKRSVIGLVMTQEVASAEPAVKIILCFGMTSRDKVEWILQKGTEIGVAEFSPFISSRTLVQSAAISEKKLVRWERIIREAAEQSHRGRLPKLNQPQDFEACLSSSAAANSLSLIAWEGDDSDQMNIAQSLLGFEGSSIALYVGPEGGFSNEEILLAKAFGCRVVTLGDRILRMETAAIVFPVIVLHDLGEL
ncbi:MAG: RsmE family RNA methyltransferase [Brevefilum sp.]|nr:RsmE family RNA methyltransferase [Brevefilum sp.]MDT8380810.1 RsmE family RNA methyltransferase [Brevefilum sp.]MDW7754684.1 RsmE family RNA methyltransferase [Brevefilum sp.]